MSDQGSTTTTIQMSGPTLLFYQGVAAGNKVLEAHADQPIPDLRTRLNLFWFYVGAIAVDEHGIKEPDDFAVFITGAATQAPQEDDEEEERIAELAELPSSMPRDTPNVTVIAGHHRELGDADSFGPFETAGHAYDWVVEQYRSDWDTSSEGAWVTYTQPRAV